MCVNGTECKSILDFHLVVCVYNTHYKNTLKNETYIFYCKFYSRLNSVFRVFENKKMLILDLSQ